MPFDQQYPATAARQIFTNPNTFATTMVVVLIDYYGTECLGWSPETIRLETERDFGFTWPLTNFDRLMAGIQLLTSNSFYKSTPDFIDICNILSGSPATPGQFDLADSLECAWGVTEALLLAPPEKNDHEPFSKEICAYIGKVLELEGIITPPDILRIATFDEDRKLKVHSAFSDDPEMYNAIWDTEASKTSDINENIKESLIALVNQLASISLQNGSTADIAKKMLANLNALPDGGSALA